MTNANTDSPRIVSVTFNGETFWAHTCPRIPAPPAHVTVRLSNGYLTAVRIAALA